MGHFRIFNQLLVFFTAKNILVLTLQLYRLAVITLDFRATILQKSRKGEVSCCPCEPYEASTQATAEQDTEMKEFIDFPVRVESQAPSKDQWAQLLTQNQLLTASSKGLGLFLWSNRLWAHKPSLSPRNQFLLNCRGNFWSKSYRNGTFCILLDFGGFWLVPYYIIHRDFVAIVRSSNEGLAH